MNNKFKLITGGVLVLLGAFVGYLYINRANLLVLNPKGIIAEQQKDLFILTSLLSLIVVIPVFVMLFLFAWKYRATNTKAKYSPDWDHHLGLEATWWGVPMALISVLAVITWQTTHSLDPFKPISAQTPPLKVQVVSLQWRWLFIYPEQNIATIDYLQFPSNRPLNLELTADAPMNSFWVPQLGGQIYTMSGMSTKLHLMADQNGTYHGRSANLSGEGFADMSFVAKSTSDEDFNQWVQSVKRSPRNLDASSYDRLAQPTRSQEMLNYSSVDDQLYETVISKYMPAGHGGHR